MYNADNLVTFADVNDAESAAEADQVIAVISNGDTISFAPIDEADAEIGGRVIALIRKVQVVDADEPEAQSETEQESDGQAPYPLSIVWDGYQKVAFPTSLVDDLITEKSIGFVAAESQAGKTYIMIDLAFALALGQTFFGKSVKQGGVLYIAAEAPGTIPIRMEAARRKRALPLVAMMREPESGDISLHAASHLPIAVHYETPDLTKPLELEKLIATAKIINDDMLKQYGVPLRVIIIDTVIAAFPIKSWNDPADTMIVTRAMAKICKATDAAVVGVAHHGKDIGKGIAGSFALKANVDFVLSIIMNTGDDALSGKVVSRHIALTKWRDGPTGWQHQFNLENTPMGTNDDGKAVYSAYVEPVIDGFRLGAVKKSKKLPVAQQTALRALKEAISESGEDATDLKQVPAGTKVVSVDQWRAFAYRAGISASEAPRARQVAFQRAVEGLVAAHQANVCGQYAWVTES